MWLWQPVGTKICARAGGKSASSKLLSLVVPFPRPPEVARSPEERIASLPEAIAARSIIVRRNQQAHQDHHGLMYSMGHKSDSTVLPSVRRLQATTRRKFLLAAILTHHDNNLGSTK